MKIKTRIENDWFEDFLAVALILAIALVWYRATLTESADSIPQGDLPVGLAANPAPLTIQADDNAVTGPASKPEGDLQPVQGSGEQFFWPGQSIARVTWATVTGWFGTTAPGLSYGAPALPTEDTDRGGVTNLTTGLGQTLNL